MKLQTLLFAALSSGISRADAYNARVFATNPLRYNKLNETSGTAIVDSSSNGFTGTYSGVDLANANSSFPPDKMPFWDGTNDYGNLYSAAFANAFNMDEFTIMWWATLNSAAVWTDTIERYFLRIQRDSSNQLLFRKSNSNNTLSFTRIANGASKAVSAAGQSDTVPMCLAVSCSIAGGGLLNAGDFLVLKNGVQLGTKQTGAVASAGTGLNNTATTLGSSNVTPTNVHHGWFERLLFWNRPIDAGILALMNP